MESVKERAYEFLLKYNLGGMPQNFIQLGNKGIGFKIYTYDEKREFIEKSGLNEYTENYLAFALEIKNQVTIFYNRNITFSVRDFVIGHEIGHAVLGHTSCNGILGKSKDKKIENMQEKEADAFALSLVCPTPVFLKMERYSVDEISRITGLSNEIASLAVPEIIKEKTVEKTKVEEDLLFLFRGSIEKYKKQEKKCENQIALSGKENKINWKIVSFISSGFLCGILILVIVFSKNTMQLNQTIYSNSTAYASSDSKQKEGKSKDLTKETASNKSIVYITQSGKKYHTIDCKYIKGKEGITSLKLSEAIEKDLTACNTYNPN